MVVELTKAIERQGLDMHVGALVSLFWMLPCLICAWDFTVMYDPK